MKRLINSIDRHMNEGVENIPLIVYSQRIMLGLLFVIGAIIMLNALGDLLGIWNWGFVTASIPLLAIPDKDNKYEDGEDLNIVVRFLFWYRKEFLIECFGEVLGNHFHSKVLGYNTSYSHTDEIKSRAVLAMLTDMSHDNQKQLMLYLRRKQIIL